MGDDESRFVRDYWCDITDPGRGADRLTLLKVECPSNEME